MATITQMIEHCCDDMRTRVEWSCELHGDRYDCADAIVDFVPEFQEYGLIVHDGGSSKISIAFCPWCGARLPESQRERWFDELEGQGFENPLIDEIPERYRDDRWLRDP